jgi:hypothetical protein
MIAVATGDGASSPVCGRGSLEWQRPLSGPGAGVCPRIPMRLPIQPLPCESAVGSERRSQSQALYPLMR